VAKHQGRKKMIHLEKDTTGNWRIFTMEEAKFYYKNENAPKPNKPNHIGTCAIIHYGEKLLLEKRTDSNRWALIGGGLKIDESLEQGIVREINEETGLVVKEESLSFWKIFSDPTRIGEYPDGNIVRIISAVYLLKLGANHKLICSEESQELRYFSCEEIKKLNIAETHRHIIDEYLMLSTY
jgi:ADP-ribose pyrophosphatase YjhB (NUDIX family)